MLKVQGLSAQGYWWQIDGFAWFDDAWVDSGCFNCLGNVWLILIKFKPFSLVSGSRNWSISSSGMLEHIPSSKSGCQQLV